MLPLLLCLAGYRGSHRRLRRFNGRNLQHRDVALSLAVWKTPRITPLRFGVSGDLEQFDNAFPNGLVAEHFYDRHRLFVLRLAVVHEAVKITDPIRTLLA
jgi:hypothetical protein